MVAVRDDENNVTGIECDRCGKPAPNTLKELMPNGLIGLGWKCSGGRHICPGPHGHPHGSN